MTDRGRTLRSSSPLSSSFFFFFFFPLSRCDHAVLSKRARLRDPLLFSFSLSPSSFLLFPPPLFHDGKPAVKADSITSLSGSVSSLFSFPPFLSLSFSTLAEGERGSRSPLSPPPFLFPSPFQPYNRCRTVRESCGPLLFSLPLFFSTAGSTPERARPIRHEPSFPSFFPPFLLDCDTRAGHRSSRGKEGTPPSFPLSPPSPPLLSSPPPKKPRTAGIRPNKEWHTFFFPLFPFFFFFPSSSTRCPTVKEFRQ